MEISSFITMHIIGVTTRFDKEWSDEYLAIMISVGSEFN